ncbi:MAG: ATP phosphoribosyltransferase regulatory subunit [Clostridia bacterium]|nr:ATP phosphoribosyltransferase regulatory subunit [Clostridia bacterium]
MYTARDLFSGRREIMTAIERNISNCYKQRGYTEISTPMLEEFSMFSGSNTPLDSKRTFKLIDDGEIMVIRPDSTAPIGRIVATKISDQPLPLRLRYSQEVLIAGSDCTETSQCGIELIGADGIRADVELIETAVAALDAAGAEGFKIELGHAGIFRNLIKDIPLTKEDTERLRRAIEVKNTAEVNRVLDGYGGYETAAIRRLPRLFGGREVFAQARELILQPEAAEAVKYLESVYSMLEDIGCGEYIMADLALVNNMNYYTGVILGAYAEGSGERVLSGGRYDGLLEHYGKNLSATGFAVNLDALCRTLDREVKTVSDIMVWYAEGRAERAYSLSDELRRDGKTVELSTFESLEKSISTAKDKGIPCLIAIDSDERYLKNGVDF